MELVIGKFQKLLSPVKGEKPSSTSPGNEDKKEADIMILDANKRDTGGNTALYEAAARGDCGKLVAFIKAGADVNIANKDRQTALFRAAKKGHDECVEILIKAGVDVNITDRDGNTALFKAAEKGHTKCVKLLVEAGTGVNRKNKFGHTALYRAAVNGRSGRANGIEILLKAGADVNVVTSDGTCITRSIMSDGIQVTKALLNAGAHVNWTDHEGVPGLYRAVEKAKTDRVKMFVNAGADVNMAIPQQNYTALMEAAGAGNIDIVRLLVNAGADVNKYAYGMKTALSMAADKNHTECVNLLTKAGAHVNSMDDDGNTALMSVACDRSMYGEGAIRTAKTLLRLGAHVNKNSRTSRKAIRMNSQYDGQMLALLIAAGEMVTEEEDLLCRMASDPVPLLQHLYRGAIRKCLLDVDLHENLFMRVPKIGLPSRLMKYLLFDISIE